MDKDPSKSIDKRTPEEVLAEAIVNPVYDEYAFGEEGRFQPLTESMIDDGTRSSLEFQTVRDVIGMPTMEHDSAVTPPFTYAGKDELMRALFASEEAAMQFDEMDKHNEADITRKKNLNNLNARLAARPAKLTPEGVREKSDDESMQDIIFGVTPALIRAQAVAPDLMNSLREVLLNATSTRDRIQLLDSSDVVSGGVYMAYRIMGRLVKEEDEFYEAYVQGRADADSKDAFEPVSSAHKVITR